MSEIENPAPETTQAPETPAGPTPEQLLKEAEAKYLYLYAEFENYKKRVIKERSELIKFGWENVARDLLEVADNLGRALQHTPPGTDKNFASGIQMVLQNFRNTLKKQGVEIMETLNKPFDPNYHEGVGQIPSEQPSGIIVQEQQQGYLLHGRLLRPARVLISSGTPPASS